MGTNTKKETRQQADSSGSGQKAGSQPDKGGRNKGGRSASSGGRTKGGGQPGGGQAGGQGGK